MKILSGENEKVYQQLAKKNFRVEQLESVIRDFREQMEEFETYQEQMVRDFTKLEQKSNLYKRMYQEEKEDNRKLI